MALPLKAEKGMRPRELWKTTLPGTFMASPLLRDGLLYTIESQKCRLHLLDAATGADLSVSPGAVDSKDAGEAASGWKIDGLKPAHFAYASPVAASETLYFFDDAGNTVVLTPGREHKLIRVNKLDDSLIGTPFFKNQEIIFRGNESISCIGENP